MVYTNTHGIVLKDKNKLAMFLVAIGFAILSAISMILPARAAHNGANVEVVPGECGETTFNVGIIDPDGTHVVENMRLVVHADGVTQNVVVPVDGSQESITVGPFFGSGESETVSWRVFGGDERDYDTPSWTGYGEAGFGAAVTAYGTANGFSWVVAGPDDPNPFTNWNEIVVNGCEITKDMCKQDGYALLGFRNQGQCIRFVNTGQDSR